MFATPAAGRAPAALALCFGLTALLCFSSAAQAGIYPMNQCGAAGSHNVEAMSGYGGGGFYNGCTSGGGTYGLAKASTSCAFEYDKACGITFAVPGSSPSTTIRQVAAQWDTGGGTWSGNSAFVRWFSGGAWLADILIGSGYTTSSFSLQPPAGARDVTIDLYCSFGNGPQNCSSPDSHVVRIPWMSYTLGENDSPGAGSFGGSIVQPGARRGIQTLTYTATDRDSGVRSVQIKLGGTVVGAADFSGQCLYDSWNACPKSQTQPDVNIDTTQVTDGTHPLRLVVTDAASNTATLDAGSVTVQNAPIPNAPITSEGGSNAQQGSVHGSSPASNQTATSSTSTSKEVCNGSVCPDHAALTSSFFDGSAQMRIHYGANVSINGRLTTMSGDPIADAKVDVIWTGTTPETHDIPAGPVVTDSQGRWSYLVPKGPSRTLRFAWRSRDTSTSYAEKSDVHLLVIPKLTVRPTRRTIRTGRTVTLVGRVAGSPYPPAGVLVTLQGRAARGGRWRTFGVTRTRSDTGKFRRAYRFKSATRGVYLFRARVSVQAGYDYVAGRSKAVRATVRS